MCLKGRKVGGARVRRTERKNEGDRMSARKNSFNLKKVGSYGGQRWRKLPRWKGQ